MAPALMIPKPPPLQTLLWSLDPCMVPAPGSVLGTTEDIGVTHQPASLFLPASSLHSVPLARPVLVLTHLDQPSLLQASSIPSSPSLSWGFF